jgi:uncharacterized protein
MPETKKEKMSPVLKTLRSSGDIEGAAVITRDGLLISGELNKGIDGDNLAAMAAAMIGAAETAVQELGKGTPDRVIVESKKAKMITIGAGEQAILVCIVGADAKLGLILMEMKKAARSIEKEAA